MEQFSWLQCAAIRNTDHLAAFRPFVDYDDSRGAGKPATRRAFHDVAVGAFLAGEYDAYALWCPSLVQHAEVKSAFFNQAKDTTTRTSKSYKQAYG
jgi:hypothetical protein